MNDVNSQQGQPTDLYQYNYTYIEPVPMISALPQGENFSPPWIVMTAKQAFQLAINTLIANRGEHGEQGVEDDVRNFLYETLLKTLREQGPTFKFKLVGALVGLLPQLLAKQAEPRGGGADLPVADLSEAEVAAGVEAAVQYLLQGLPVEAAEPGVPLDAGVEAAKGVDIALQQLGQGVVPENAAIEATPRGVPSSETEMAKVQQVLPSRAEVEVAKGIEAAVLLQQGPDTVATDRLSDGLPTVTGTESALNLPEATKAEVARGVETALKGLVQSAPANETDVEKLMNSNLVKVLGSDLLKPLAHNLLKGLQEKAPSGRPQGLEDYEKLFAVLKLPEIAKTFQDDAVFAYLRLAGANPVMIERMTATDRRFPVTEEQYQSVMGSSDSLAAAMAAGRVYLADYGILDGALNGTYGPHPQTQKYGYAPLAMFAVPVDGKLLKPVAIQCGQNPAEHAVITPSTGAAAWLIAKTVVNIADTNFHEAVSHFARTHLLVEPFVMATHRQLPADHPLFKLLVPHFQGTLAINDAAKGILVAPLGGVNGLLSSTIDQSRVLVVKGLQARGFNADMLPRRLQDRGVADAALPVYPYRDDGLLVWEALHDWVADYLGLYYHTDQDVKADAALQRWAAELVAFDGGRLQDFGEDGAGKVETLAYLIDAVTMVIFTGSAQHAAVNFPQNGIMSFAPAMPTAGYQPIKAIGPDTTEAEWLDLLLPLEQAQSQLNLLYLLGSVYFTRLGYYDEGHFTDAKVAEPLQKFQARLQEIDRLIDQRNTERPVYEYLKPVNIPQSINI